MATPAVVANDRLQLQANIASHTDFYGYESALPLVSQADFTALHLLCEVADEQTVRVGIYLHKCVAPWQCF